MELGMSSCLAAWPPGRHQRAAHKRRIVGILDLEPWQTFSLAQNAFARIISQDRSSQKPEPRPGLAPTPLER